MYNPFHGHSILMSKQKSRMDIYHMVDLSLIIKNWQFLNFIFQSSCALLHFHQRYMKVPVAPILGMVSLNIRHLQ